MRKVLIVLTCLLFPALAMAQNTPPVADAGEDQTVYLGSSVALHGTAIDADGDEIVGWMWGTEESPAGSTPLIGAQFSADASFLADEPGDYVLSLIAFDGADWSLPDTVVITYIQNQPPTASATAVPLTGTVPLTVQFDGLQSFDPENAALIYAWEFGDGTAPSLDPAPVHTYENPGRFFAQLAVEDDFGQIDFDSIEITVEEAPPAWGEASVVGLASTSPSTGLNYLIALLTPLGGVLLWKGLRKRR